MVSRRIGENGGCKRKEIETGIDICGEGWKKREMESVRLFVWTEDLKHVVPLYIHTDRTDRGSKKIKKKKPAYWRDGECAGSREKNDAPSEMGDPDEGR